MVRPVRLFARVALLSILAAPCIAWADALPGDPDDVFYHCTPEEQCPTGSEMCSATHGPAGQRPVDAECAARATAKKLERRCYGKNGHLFCPAGATGSWKGKTKVDPPSAADSSSPAPRRGCS
jgi:hypothetical protein